MNFPNEVRHRLLPHGAAIFIAWPLAATLGGILLLREHPIASGAPLRAIAAGCLVGALRMGPEWFVTGLCAFLGSVLIFGAISTGRSGVLKRRNRFLFVEPFALAVVGVAGVALEYPSILRHPFLATLRGMSVASASGILVALGVLLALALGYHQASRSGALRGISAAALLLIVTWRISCSPAMSPEEAPAQRTVLIGIDSVSQTDDVRNLQSAVRELGGTWYERPVPPGLLTNSVWPAVVMHRPAHETGVFLVFQTPDWKASPFNLVRRIRQSGCETFAFFPTRITFYLGSDVGFDKDHSGPRGWLQLATAFVKDGSVFLPAMLPRLRAIPGALTPVNQSGTFSYDVRREISSFLTERSSSACSFVASHLDYLHETAYPPYSEMNAQQRRAVLAARVETVRDLTLDWQPPLDSKDPIGIEKWKLAHVQRVLVDEIERTEFLSPKKGNRLIVFSDHGNRREINDDNFGEPRYHRVLFATFGVPGRDPREPISLLDISAMLGVEDSARPGKADPIVEYTNATSDEWVALMKTARLHANGSISLDPAIVRSIGARLRGFRPYAPGGYFPSPVRREPPN